MIVGEPGIGKTTVSESVSVLASAHGVVVLAARPAESEAQLAWSGLTDLLAEVPTQVFESLPPPQREALDTVRLLAAPSEIGLNPRAVHAALRTVVTALAQTDPLLIVVDDVQWLDSASARAITFLARRLPPAGVGLLATARYGQAEPVVRELLDTAGSTRIELGALAPPVIAEIVQRRLGVSLSAAGVQRVHTASGGNPMFAIELARVDDERPGRPVLVPDSLRDRLGRRIAGTSDAARSTLAAVAAAGRISIDQLTAAGFGQGVAEAEASELIHIAGGRVRLTHPLIGAAAYAERDIPTRRLIHAGLANVMAGSEERALHSVLSVASPTPEVLADVDAAASSASRRGRRRSPLS